MKKKILSVLFALVLVLSFSLVVAVPAAQGEEPSYASYSLEIRGNGEAGWSTDQAKTDFGNYSAEVTIPVNEDWLHHGVVKVLYGEALSTITNADLTFCFYTAAASTDLILFGQLYIDSEGGNVVDKILMSDCAEILQTGEETWKSSGFAAGDSWRVVDYDPATGVMTELEPPSTHGTLAEQQAKFPDATLIYAAAGACGYSASHAEAVVYIDDICIDGETHYDLEPIFLDTAHPYFYKTGATIGVTVPNSNANDDPHRLDSIAYDSEVPLTCVKVTSTSDDTGITIDLEETGINSGVFQTNFLTTDEEPTPADKLYVEDGDTIFVTYYGADFGTGTTADLNITATVDDTEPTIDDTLTVDGEGILVDTPGTIIFNDAPEIVATVTDVGSDIDEDSIEMTVNGEVVATDFDAGAVTYTVAPALDPGTVVEVTVDADDNMGNSAEQASWSFTIADDFNVTATPTEIAAASASTVTVTFEDVGGAGIVAPAPANDELASVQVTLSGVGVEKQYDATTNEEEAYAFLNVTPEEAGTITATFVGTFGDDSVVTKTLDISVTGFAVEETWADVYLDTPPYDISMTITTEGGAKVNTGIVIITAPAAGGFEKDVNDDGELELFQTIVINGSTSEITYDSDNAEDFVVMNGYYEVTGITFAEVGAVDILVTNVAEDPKAHFSTAFNVRGVGVYDVSLDPDTVTAGVGTEVAVTVTENGDPVTAIDSIELDSDELLGSDTSATGEYTITVSESEAGTPAVTVTGEGGQKYGTADLTIGLPSVVDYTIYETVDEEEVERNVMLTTGAYTLDVSVNDALGEPLDGFLWVGTYDAEAEEFTEINGSAIVTEGVVEDFAVDAPTEACSLVWMIGSGDTLDETQALVEEPFISVQSFSYDLNPTEATVDVATTYTVTDNYIDPAADRDVKIVTPAIETVLKTTGPAGTPLAGKFMYTAAEVGNYYVSVKLDDGTWQEAITVTVSEEAVEFDPMVYDEDGDGAISKSEALTSVTDYFAGEITKAQALEVIALYFAS